jgi:CheY-like chemotaxis protein
MALISIQKDTPPNSRIPLSAGNSCSNVAETALQNVYGTMDSLGTRQVLVVDDDAECLKLVSKMVIHLGDQPTMACNGSDALDHLCRANYDLVITDFEMPIIDGGQLAGQIKKRCLGTRIIVMTGGWEGDVDDLIGAGFVDGLLFKPFSLNSLQEKIKMVCQGHDQYPFQPR